MTSAPTVPSAGQAAQALDLAIAAQQSPETACAYLGTDADDIRADLEDLDQPWPQTLRILTAQDGSVTAACAIEWDEESGRAWLQGPWAAGAVSAADLAGLVDACVAVSPVKKVEMYADQANTAMALAAAELGWRTGETNHEYELSGPLTAGACTATIRSATGDDLEAVSALHEAEFPGTYATARQLLADGEYTTLLAEDSSGLLGYAAGQPRGERLYLDFVAVASSARRRGVARALLAALQERIGPAGIRLTVDGAKSEVLAAYDALGFRQTAVTLPYRSW